MIQPAVPHHEIPALIAESDICTAPPRLNDPNVTQARALKEFTWREAQKKPVRVYDKLLV